MMMKSKSSILILLILTSIASSFTEELTVEGIKELQKAVHESSEYMTREVGDEDAIIFVGATGSGKSTLINYLIGNELVAESPSRFHPITIRKSDPLSIGPEIGAGSTSTIPTKWTSTKLPHLAIWDSPGFEDNRGPVQDITNAFYMYQLLQKAKSLRVVLAVDINDILNDNVQPFVSVLNVVEDMLRYKNETHSSILTIIFTKVPDIVNDVLVDMKLLTGILSEKVLRSSITLSDTSRDIVEFLINNNNRIAFFKRAKPGLVTSDIDVNIFPAITSSSQLEGNILKGLRPSISSESKVYLNECKNKLMSMDAFDNLLQIVTRVIDKKMHDFNSTSNAQEAENKIWAHISQLYQIERHLIIALAYEPEFYRKMEIFHSIDADITKEIQTYDLIEVIQLMEIADKLLGGEENNALNFSLQLVLAASAGKVRDAITSSQLRRYEIINQRQLNG